MEEHNIADLAWKAEPSYGTWHFRAFSKLSSYGVWWMDQPCSKSLKGVANPIAELAKQSINVACTIDELSS